MVTGTLGPSDEKHMGPIQVAALIGAWMGVCAAPSCGDAGPVPVRAWHTGLLPVGRPVAPAEHDHDHPRAAHSSCHRGRTLACMCFSWSTPGPTERASRPGAQARKPGAAWPHHDPGRGRQIGPPVARARGLCPGPRRLRARALSRAAASLTLQAGRAPGILYDRGSPRL